MSEHYDPWPLDYRVLELMPEIGLIAGVHNAGRTVPALVDEINEQAGQVVVTSSQVSSRVRVMRENGLCDHFPATGGMVWARTPLGRRVAETRSWPPATKAQGNGRPSETTETAEGELAQAELEAELDRRS